MAYYGNTLTDVMAGINTSDAMRAQERQSQDAMNANRMAALANLVANRERTGAGREAAVLQAAAQMQQLRQAQEASSMDRALKEREIQAETDRVLKTIEAQKAIAEIQSKAMDPRLASAYTRLLGPEAERAAEKADMDAMAQTISAQKKALIGKRDELKKQYFGFGPNWLYGNRLWGDPNASGDRDTVVVDLDNQIKALDARAAAIGLVPTAEGGYVTPYGRVSPQTTSREPYIATDSPPAKKIVGSLVNGKLVPQTFGGRGAGGSW